MTDTQRADPAARRKAIIIIIISGIVGSLLILAFERYQTQLYEWLQSDYGRSAHRVKILIILAAAFGAVSLFSLSTYLWSLGCKVSNSQQIPLPGQRVIRDTPILEGQATMTRVRVLKTIAVLLAGAGVMLCLVFWRIFSILEESVA